MPARLPAYRIAYVRQALRESSSASECLPALAAMVEVACELREDDLDRTGGARARRLLDEAVRYLRAVSAALPVGGEEHCLALYLLARACLRRDDAGLVPDADEAIASLRRLRATLPDGPDRGEAELLLADALLARGVRADRARDIDEAGQMLDSMLAEVPPEHPVRRHITAALAVTLGMRYIGFEGTDADRDAAQVYATGILGVPDQPDGPDDAAAAAHLMLAWIALTRQYTAEQRSVMRKQAQVEAARFDAEAAAAGLLEAFGKPRISPADAEVAISHLRQIPSDCDSGFLRTSAPMLWGLAQLALMDAGAGVSDPGPVAETLGSLAADPGTEEVQRGELLAFRAALLAGQSVTGATDELGKAVSGLPVGHLMRSPLLSILSSSLGRQVDEAGSADDLIARLDEVAAALDRLPHDDPEAAHAMTVLGAHILGTSTRNRAVFQQGRFFAQLERLAADLAPDDPLAPIAEFMIWATRHARARLEHDVEQADTALGEMIRRADLLPAGHVARPWVLSGVATAYMERHSIRHELRNLELANKAINDAIAEAAAGGPFAEGTVLHGHLLYLRGHLGVLRAAYSPSLPSVNEAIEDLERAEAEVGHESGRLGVIASLGTARFLREGLTKPIGPDMTLSQAASDIVDRLLDAAERAGRDSLEYPVLASQAAAGLMMRGLAASDVTLVDRAIALQAGVCAIATLGLRERPRMLELHGSALHTRYSITRDPRDLSNAIARLEEARRAVEQEPGNPYAGDVLQSLASAYRSRANQALGDVDRAVLIGLAGLRERAANVLLQDNDDNALDVARQATNDATEMARWFLARDWHSAAVSAIELGRGMVLHAATAGTGVGEALSKAGHPELALEWTAQATRSDGAVSHAPLPGDWSEPPQDDDLRYRAMLALEGTPAEARLLSPPTVADIAAALASSGADALVYLLPHDDTGLGVAVLIDHVGTVSSLPLLRLRGGSGTAVGEFLRTRRAVERVGYAAGAAFDAARADWLAALDAVCDWAWQAAIGPLLRTFGRRSGASFEPRAADPLRLVLVPGGELGLVPWHAARRAVSESQPGDWPARYDYACSHAVISYASSARQFIDATRRRVRPWTQAPVLISDADGSLFAAKTEVAHLHAAHYASGALFGCARGTLGPGVSGAAAARPQDVLDALPHGEYHGASLLHFGCHGRVRMPVLGSDLVLRASPRGSEVSVSVRDILRQARTGQAQASGGGLVVLASCLTDATEADHDEALTLATAFLAAGSNGVVAARWSVPDAATALFMLAFHRFLNSGHGDPAHALREAQLWMLNPRREVPDDWPKPLRQEADLDGRPDGPNLTSTEAWAAFTYQGR